MTGKTKKRILVWGIVAAVIVVLILIATNANLVVRRYTIASDKIERPIRAVFLSDLHSCAYGTGQQELIDAIHAQQPDVILMGGDMCDEDMPRENTELVLQGITEAYPCYYVTGNHEYWDEDVEEILEMFRSYGVTMLEGQSDTVTLNGQTINICGVSDPDVAMRTPDGVGTGRQLEALKDVGDNGYFTLLLSHRPELIDLYVKYGFDLVLSGHAHGGQWRIPGIINGLFAPDQGFFPKFAGGAYTQKDTRMIVGRGLARETTPAPRVFNPPELVVVELTPQPN